MCSIYGSLLSIINDKLSSFSLCLCMLTNVSVQGSPQIGGGTDRKIEGVRRPGFGCPIYLPPSDLPNTVCSIYGSLLSIINDKLSSFSLCLAYLLQLVCKVHLKLERAQIERLGSVNALCY